MVLPFLAAIGGWLAKISVATWIQAAITVGSAMYQRRRQKKMQAQVDAQKGFDIVIDGEPIHLPRVYGYQKVGGVRTVHETMNSIDIQTPSAGAEANEWTQLRFPWFDWDEDGPTATSKNQYMITQQALCMGGVEGLIDVEVNSQSWDKHTFKHQIDFAKNGGIANPTATASGIPATNKFTNCSWISAAYWLDRDTYNYQGVPNLSAFIKGQRVWKITSSNTLSATKSFSVNNAECLLDYLLAPKALGGFGLSGQTATQWLNETPVNMTGVEINLASFFYAKQICDTTVSSDVNARGRVNGIPDIDHTVTDVALPSPTVIIPPKEDQEYREGDTIWHKPEDRFYKRTGEVWTELTNTRTIKLYECNLTVDTGRPFRDNLELFLETMGEADLIYSEGAYKLILEYPTSDAEQDAVISGVYDDSYIVSEGVVVTQASAKERWNRATVKFNNEETDFTQDSVSWPAYNDANHQALLAEDAGIESTTEIFIPGITHRELALAKAENIVRASRIMVGDALENETVNSANQKVIQVKFDRRFLVHDVGDLFELTSPDAEIDQEVYKVEKIKYDGRLNSAVIASRFNHTNLKYSDKVTVKIPPRQTIDVGVSNVTGLTWTAGARKDSVNSNGYLTWTTPSDMDALDVKVFHVYTSLDNQTWYKIGESSNGIFDVGSEYDDVEERHFLVKVENVSSVYSAGTAITVSTMSTIVAMAPVDVTTTPVAEGISISWDYSAHSIVGRYEVFLATVDTKPVTPTRIVTGDPNVTLQGLVGNQAYFMWIDVVGDSGTRAEMVTSFTETSGRSSVLLASVTAANQLIQYGINGTGPTPSTVLLTATSKGFTTPFYEFVVDGVSEQNSAQATYVYSPNASHANMPEAILVNVREGDDVSAVLATDIVTISAFKDGEECKRYHIK